MQKMVINEYFSPQFLLTKLKMMMKRSKSDRTVGRSRNKHLSPVHAETE